MNEEKGIAVDWASNLRCAIIEQAAVDYAKALKGIKQWKETKQTDYRKRYGYERTVADCETFFRSKWFNILCNIDGEKAIKAIRQRVLGEEKC